MPTSPHPDLPSWPSPAWEDPAPAAEPDRLASEPSPEFESPQHEPGDSSIPAPRGAQTWTNASWTTTAPVGTTFDDDIYETALGAQTTETEYVAPPGMPGRGVILTSSAAALGCAAVDFALTRGLTIFFDLCFIVVCLVGAMAVRRRDIFTTGVLAPLVFAGVIAVVSLVSPQTFVAQGDLSKVFLTGLAAHAGALVVGYAVALATVSGRVSVTRPAP